MMRPDGAFDEGSESDQASAFLKKYRELEKFDPSLEQDIAENEVEEGGTATSNLLDSDNTRDEDEISATRATIYSLIATCFEFTDIPVFWPILLVYFLVLFSITMKRQIAHMRRYKYVPWDYMVLRSKVETIFYHYFLYYSPLPYLRTKQFIIRTILSVFFFKKKKKKTIRVSFL
ncbi:Rer1 family-domain-containing protein [Phakopsora pachyrhizi]|nr:Rer1 family-domain-containing protein [Phakopsora pachyrhizi]